MHNNLANLLKSQRHYESAGAHYQKALELHPKYLQAWRNLAICQQAQSAYELAIATFEKTLELAQKPSKTLVLILAPLLVLFGGYMLRHVTLELGQHSHWNQYEIQFDPKLLERLHDS